jgi:hypothetical protein
MNGAEAKIKPAIRSIFRLPIKSDRDAAGRLIKIPGIVEAAATIPSRSSGVPRLVANGFSTGFFDIVELKIAKKPIKHIIAKKAHLTLLFLYIPFTP